LMVGVVYGFLLTLLAVGVLNTWLISRVTWPSGPPVEISSAVLVDDTVTVSDRIKMVIDVTKTRYCSYQAQLMIEDAAGEIRAFNFQSWPSLRVGHSGPLHVATDVPTSLSPGTHQLQAAVTYDCNDGYYVVFTPKMVINVET